ncbi:MAG: thioredoxin [Deltaproteobacteria bacterium RBG_13_61_14]|nr:MAG: thioredoxin [Deltaproteobacteria bacterium RBG_13_61_14]
MVAQSRPFAVKDEDFEALVLRSELPVVVDFWAPWCGPCKVLSPVLDDLAQTYSGKVLVAKMNVDENKMVPARFGIRGLPALLLFKQGKVKGTLSGSTPRKKVEEMLLRAV